MRSLRRKAVRDLWGSRALFLGTALLLALGVGMFVAMYSAFRNVAASEALTYRELKFADVFYTFVPTTSRAVDRIKKVSGVSAVEGRIVRDLPLRRPNDPRSTVVGRLISLPEEGRPSVNDVKIRRGGYLPDGTGKSVIIDEQFANYYGLDPGDSVALRIEDRDTEFEVAGTFTSPEYIWKAKSSVEPFVARGEFAVVMARGDIVADLLAAEGLVNEITVRFEPGSDPDATLDRLDDAISRYGTNQVTEREDQISYALLQLDLEGFQQMAVAVPALFLIVTAMTVYVSLTRTVRSQRPLIGLMRAEGYSRGQILRHYLTFAVIVGAVGGVVGTPIGLVLGSYVTELYVNTLSIPLTAVEIQPDLLAIGIAVGIAVCVTGGLQPALSAARLDPSEAMRPGVYRAIGLAWVQRLSQLGRTPYTLRLGLRNMVRGPWRTLSSIMGLMMAVGLVLAALGMFNSMNRGFSVQFDEIQKYDLKVIFTRPTHTQAMDVYLSWPEVGQAEPIAEVPIEIKNGDNSKYTVLTALSERGTLMRLPLLEGAEPLQGSGIFLTDNLADQLGAVVGDEVTVKSEERDETYAVAGLVRQPLSEAAYMNFSEAYAVLRGSYASGGLLKLNDPSRMAAVEERLESRPGVLVVEQKEQVRRSFQELMSAFYQFLAIFGAFAAALGGFTVFNTVTINVIERTRELATMRTLGFSRLQIDALITAENLLAGSIGILLGFLMGYLLSVLLLDLSSGESFTLETYISPVSYLLVGTSALLIVVVSQVPGLRSLHRLNLAEAAKERLS